MALVKMCTFHRRSNVITNAVGQFPGAVDHLKLTACLFLSSLHTGIIVCLITDPALVFALLLRNNEIICVDFDSKWYCHKHFVTQNHYTKVELSVIC